MISFKELYDVHLKLTYPIEIGDRSFEEGETVAIFDKIQIAGLNQNKEIISANGGFDNRAHVFWENTKEIELKFSQGVFSKEQFALMSNSKILSREQDEQILITIREEKETDEAGFLELKEKPVGKIFVYRKDNGEKMSFIRDGKILSFREPFLDVIIIYQFDYSDNAEVIKIGRALINGYLELEGKTKIKDDITGQVVTGLIKIPKLKLMSDLSIRLGMQANPVVANFTAVGIPVGQRGNSYVSEFYFLNNDIDSDI